MENWGLPPSLAAAIKFYTLQIETAEIHGETAATREYLLMDYPLPNFHRTISAAASLAVH